MAESPEDTDSMSSGSWLEDTLITSLQGLHLDVHYWLDILQPECEVTDDDEVRLCNHSDFKKIEKLVQHDWEVKALMQMLDIGGYKHRTEEKAKAQHLEEQCSQLLGALICERDRGKSRYDRLVREYEQKLKQALQIPDDVWVRSCRHLSLDGFISHFNSQLAEMDELAMNRNELSPSDLLQQASGGLALKGILVSKDAGECTNVCETVIEVPKAVVLNSLGPSQKECFRLFSSQLEADNFHKSLSTLGHSIASTTDNDLFQLQTEAGISPSTVNDLKKDSKETCLSKVKVSYIPTACCQVEKKHLQLSKSALHDLRELERLTEGTPNQTFIQKQSENFLKKYGSHINVGKVVFGGIYTSQATYCSKASSSAEKVQGVLNDAFGGLVNMSYSGLGITSDGTVSPDQIIAHADIAASYDYMRLSNTTMKVSTTGGPQAVKSLPLWAMGLVLCSETWAIIDRGCSFHRDFVGIWELIRNNRTEFSDARKLAQTLQDAWRMMSGLPPDSTQSDDEVENAKRFLSEILENDLQEWIVDEKFSSNAVEYLETLLDEVKQCCSDAAGTDFWIMKLKTHKALNSFLKHTIEMNLQYSYVNLKRVYHYLSELLTLTQGYEYPLRNAIKEFLSTKIDESIQGILGKETIKDILNLIAILKETLLPKMEAFDDKSGSVEPDPVHQIHLQGTRDLEIVVDNYLVHLETANNPYVLLLLRVALHEVNYDRQNKGFSVPFTEQSLAEFTQRLENLWEEFLLHKGTGIMEMQAMLIHLLINSLSEDAESREQDFQEFMRGIHKLLVSDMADVLSRFTSPTPYDWNCLIAGLEEMKKGKKYNLQNQALEIAAFHAMPRSETKKFQSEIYADDFVPDEGTAAWNLLDQLGLTDYYPSKISLQDVMTIGNRSCRDIKIASSLPWRIIQKLIMLNYNARDHEPASVVSENQTDSDESQSGDDCTLDTLLGDFAFEEGDDISLNPLDVFLAVYSCCDMMLKQTLAQKMVQCRLAVPFLSPPLSDGLLSYSLWALRSTIVEWKNKEQVCMETSVVDQPVKTVSFLKLGEPSCSKSMLLNNIISDQPHHTFWNRECPLGHSDRSIANGLVEAQWYIPAGKATDNFEDMTMFLNLRGDACLHQKQVQFLQAISDVVVCCIETSDLDNKDVLRMMNDIHRNSSKVVLLLANKDPESLNKQGFKKQSDLYLKHIGKFNMANTKTIPGFKGNKVRTTEDLKKDMRTTLCKFMAGHTGRSMESMSVQAKEMGIHIDEDENICKRAKEMAVEVISCMGEKSTNDCKKEMLPLQGDDWQQWSKLLKDKQYSGHSDVIYEKAQTQVSMTQLRQNQLEICNNLSQLMRTFLGNLLEVIDSPVESLYMQWLKIYLDQMSRNTLPGLRREYHKKWLEFYASKKDGENAANVKKELEAEERQVAEASLGVEHLFREVAQMYEAAVESKKELSQSTREFFYQLPTIAAKLLLKGQPMEIMDGDAANVPLTWVKAVLASLKGLVGDKKLFVLSVLGIQSSGKSTLLNTMFGLQFAVSAGRCTRGVYMQLIKVDKERSDLPYDYVIVVDTEGLGAPELGQLKHNNDNQLATFVIGLGDVTILNIKGENVAEVSDVLQIAVHAFLRMKLVNKNFQLHRTCMFIHQNVPAINAKEKMQSGCQKLKERLDEMTREASSIENIVDIQSFNDVIEFDGESNVFYFSDLWHGDPPMAPANPGYSEKVQEVKDCLLYKLSQKQETFLSFLDLKLRIEDLWKGVLSENFVFSFRNSLAAKAYNSLESIYQGKSWEVENSISEWITQEATVQLERCSTSEELDRCCLDLSNQLQRVASTLHDSAHADLEQFFDTHNQKDILIQWKTEKMECLNTDMKLVIRKGETEIHQKKERLNDDLLQNARLAELKVEIMTKAQNLANEMKGQKSDDGELHLKFETFWTEWRNDYSDGTAAASVPIESIVENLLYKRLTKESAALEKELSLNPLSKHLNVSSLEGSVSCTDITKEHLSIRKSLLGRLKALFSQGSWRECQQPAAGVVNSILQNVDTHLADVSKLDSGFQELFAKNVIKKIADGVETYNSKPDQIFTLLPNLKVKIAVHACRYAVGVFMKMQGEYEENHGIRKKLDSYRNAAWNLFKNTLQQSKIEVIAADLLSNHLENLVRDLVKNRMSGEIVNHVVRYFNHTKFNLIVKILTDLTERPFADYESFISSPKDFALPWITSFTKKEMFYAAETTSSKYAMYAGLQIDKLGECIRRSVKATTEIFKEQRTEGHSIHKWIGIFCERLKELPIKENDLKPVLERDVKDFEHFEKLLMDRVKTVEQNVLTGFKSDKVNSLKWEDKTPYTLILDRLWGCEARCPFCKEVCQRSDPKHLSPNDTHQCIQHRPTGVGGVRCTESQILWVESCNFDIQSNKTFLYAGLPECKVSASCVKGEYYPLTEYKKFLPAWDIAPSPNMDSSKYWMWVMAKYKHQLATMHTAKVPYIPEAWNYITKQEALDSLRVYTN